MLTDKIEIFTTFKQRQFKCVFGNAYTLKMSTVEWKRKKPQ